MPNDLLLPKGRKTNEKKCSYTVGTYSCINCVTGGKCPSNFKTIEKIGKIERGLEYCFGRQ